MSSALTSRARYGVLAAAVGGLLFDGVELGLMPVASLSVSKDLLAGAYTPALGGDWFARFTAALMLGAAVGGIVLGHLGDRIGRTRALGWSILFYSIFAGLGAWVQTQEQMLVLRFLVGLGVGGVWPNAVALASECWPEKSRPVVAGLMGAALNAGILMLSQVARTWHVLANDWRWIFHLAAAPALLAIAVLLWLPESPLWLAARAKARGVASGDASASQRAFSPIRELLRFPLRRRLATGILMGSIPLVGAWAASKWMIPWSDQVGGATAAGYKAVTQGWWALGAVLGSFCGAQVAVRLGRRLSYAAISLGATGLTWLMFLGTAPLKTGFLPTVFAQGFVATLFFGWLPLYLPELFPTQVRAVGSGIAYNVGRFATALGVLLSGVLFAALGGSYPKVGAICGLIYLFGIPAVLWAPDTAGRSLEDTRAEADDLRRKA
ncbi:MAG: MFS transporter [Verrucomicrobiales bacterium]|nr:MFS transporter [Verrucomicrobiales bacterium]